MYWSWKYTSLWILLRASLNINSLRTSTNRHRSWHSLARWQPTILQPGLSIANSFLQTSWFSQFSRTSVWNKFITQLDVFGISWPLVLIPPDRYSSTDLTLSRLVISRLGVLSHRRNRWSRLGQWRKRFERFRVHAGRLARGPRCAPPRWAIRYRRNAFVRRFGPSRALGRCRLGPVDRTLDLKTPQCRVAPRRAVPLTGNLINMSSQSVFFRIVFHSTAVLTDDSVFNPVKDTGIVSFTLWQNLIPSVNGRVCHLPFTLQMRKVEFLLSCVLPPWFGWSEAQETFSNLSQPNVTGLFSAAEKSSEASRQPSGVQ